MEPVGLLGWTACNLEESIPNQLTITLSTASNTEHVAASADISTLSVKILRRLEYIFQWNGTLVALVL
jgi:hypothetical protein